MTINDAVPVRCPMPPPVHLSAPRQGAPLCREQDACRATPVTAAPSERSMPRDGVERVVVLVVRFLAAASDTGDAACWDEALDEAEQAFGLRDGTLLVARTAAFLRCLARDGVVLRCRPPPCRRLSDDEANVLDRVSRPMRPNGGSAAGSSGFDGARLSAATVAAASDCAASIASARSTSAWVSRPAPMPAMRCPRPEDSEEGLKPFQTTSRTSSKVDASQF